MQLLADLGMQTWETAKEGIYFKGIFSFYDSLFHVCVFIIREDWLKTRGREESLDAADGKQSAMGGLIVRTAILGVLESSPQLWLLSI